MAKYYRSDPWDYGAYETGRTRPPKKKGCLTPFLLMAVIALSGLMFMAGFLLCGKYGFALVGCLIGYGLALLRAYKSLDGMNGDISGYCICISELCAVLAFALL